MYEPVHFPFLPVPSKDIPVRHKPNPFAIVEVSLEVPFVVAVWMALSSVAVCILQGLFTCVILSPQAHLIPPAFTRPLNIVPAEEAPCLSFNANDLMQHLPEACDFVIREVSLVDIVWTLSLPLHSPFSVVHTVHEFSLVGVAFLALHAAVSMWLAILGLPVVNAVIRKL